MNGKLAQIIKEVDEYESIKEDLDIYQKDYNKKLLLVKHDLYSTRNLKNVEGYIRIKEFTNYMSFKYNNYYLYMRENDKEYYYIKKIEGSITLLVFEDLIDDVFDILVKYDRIMKIKDNTYGSGFRVLAWTYLFIIGFMIFLLIIQEEQGFILFLLPILIIPIMLFAIADIYRMINDVKEEVGLKQN